MYPNVHNSTIYNNQNTGAPQVTINRQMGQDTHTHSQWNIAAKLLQSCPTLCNPIDGSLPDSPIPGILQARTLEWVAISFSNAWKWKVTVKSLSRVQPSVTPWTAAHQVPTSMGFSRQEYWSGAPLLSPWWTSQHIKKQKHYFADKGPYSQSYCFTSSHVGVWKLAHKEGWVPKNLYFQSVML